MSSHSSNSNGINDIMSVKTLKNDTKCINTEKIYVKESMVASSISEKVTPSTKLTTSITNKKPTNLTNVQNLHLLKNNKNNNNDKNNSISTQLNTNSILLNRNNLTIERQLLQTYNYFMYNGQLINNSIYTNITHDNNITYYQAVNILSMMAPLSIMQSSPYPTQMTYEFIPICQTQKDDTKDSQKDQISNKKLDSNSQSHTTNLHHHHHHHQHQQNSQHLKSTKSSKTRHNKRGTTNSNSSNDNKTSSHPWLASNLKGHTDDIHDIDFSNNGKFLASCSEDRTVLIWSTNQLEDAKDRKWFRLNIQYDYGIKLAWSPDSKAIAILKSAENCIEVYKVDRKDGWFSSYERCLTFPKVTNDEIVGFGIACTGRYIITCTNKTDLYIWSLKGSILEKIDTYLMNTYSVKISPCGRFVAACGFAPDCKIWEVKFSRNGEYQKTVRAFDLTGHSSGIYDCAFDQDSSHIVTVSKDSSWKLFDIKIEFDKGQLPRCLKTGKYTIGSTDPIGALSLNAEVLAIASGNQIQLFSMFTGELDIIIKNVYEGPITKIIFDPLGKYLLTAGDKHIRVYYNITGLKTSNLIAEEKLKRGAVTRATTERLEQQIKVNKNFIKKFQ